MKKSNISQIPMGYAVRQKRQSLLSNYSADLGQLVSRRRAETALRAAALESALASRAKSEFLANMSHELRTPLNAIIGFGELIEHLKPEKSSAGKPREYAGYISTAGRHLLDVINDILNLSHVESGNFKLNFTPLDLKPIIESSVLLAQSRAREKRQAIEIAVQDNLRPVMADELRLKQILINLISNASKFTGEGGRICVTAAMEEPGMISIGVEDNGIGMTPQEVERAVQPFTQIHAASSRREEGTGLGLPIAKALVLRHGGEFMIESEPNKGTTVTFNLPAVVRGEERRFGKTAK